MLVTRRSEDGQADWDVRCTEHGTDEAILGRWIPLRADTLELLLELRCRHQCKARADDDGDEHKPNLSIVVAVQLAEYNGVSEKESVEHCIDEHNVNAHEVQDWFREDHGDWPDPRYLDDFVEGEFRLLLLNDDVGVVCSLSKPCCAALEDDGRVCFGDHTHDPATISPMTGPAYGASAEYAMAIPRYSMSA